MCLLCLIQCHCCSYFLASLCVCFVADRMLPLMMNPPAYGSCARNNRQESSGRKNFLMSSAGLHRMGKMAPAQELSNCRRTIPTHSILIHSTETRDDLALGCANAAEPVQNKGAVHDVIPLAGFETSMLNRSEECKCALVEHTCTTTLQLNYRMGASLSACWL